MNSSNTGFVKSPLKWQGRHFCRCGLNCLSFIEGAKNLSFFLSTRHSSSVTPLLTQSEVSSCASSSALDPSFSSSSHTLLDTISLIRKDLTEVFSLPASSSYPKFLTNVLQNISYFDKHFRTLSASNIHRFNIYLENNCNNSSFASSSSLPDTMRFLTPAVMPPSEVAHYSSNYASFTMDKNTSAALLNSLLKFPALVRLLPSHPTTTPSFAQLIQLKAFEKNFQKLEKVESGDSATKLSEFESCNFKKDNNNNEVAGSLSSSFVAHPIIDIFKTLLIEYTPSLKAEAIPAKILYTFLESYIFSLESNSVALKRVDRYLGKELDADCFLFEKTEQNKLKIQNISKAKNEKKLLKKHEEYAEGELPIRPEVQHWLQAVTDTLSRAKYLNAASFSELVILIKTLLLSNLKNNKNTLLNIRAILQKDETVLRLSSMDELSDVILIANLTDGFLFLNNSFKMKLLDSKLSYQQICCIFKHSINQKDFLRNSILFDLCYERLPKIISKCQSNELFDVMEGVNKIQKSIKNRSNSFVSKSLIYMSSILEMFFERVKSLLHTFSSTQFISVLSAYCHGLKYSYFESSSESNNFVEDIYNSNCFELSSSVFMEKSKMLEKNKQEVFLCFIPEVKKRVSSFSIFECLSVFNCLNELECTEAFIRRGKGEDNVDKSGILNEVLNLAFGTARELTAQQEHDLNGLLYMLNVEGCIDLLYYLYKGNVYNTAVLHVVSKHLANRVFESLPTISFEEFRRLLYVSSKIGFRNKLWRVAEKYLENSDNFKDFSLHELISILPLLKSFDMANIKSSIYRCLTKLREGSSSDISPDDYLLLFQNINILGNSTKSTEVLETCLSMVIPTLENEKMLDMKSVINFLHVFSKIPNMKEILKQQKSIYPYSALSLFDKIITRALSKHAHDMIFENIVMVFSALSKIGVYDEHLTKKLLNQSIHIDIYLNSTQIIEEVCEAFVELRIRHDPLLKRLVSLYLSALRLVSVKELSYKEIKSIAFISQSFAKLGFKLTEFLSFCSEVLQKCEIPLQEKIIILNSLAKLNFFISKFRDIFDLCLQDVMKASANGAHFSSLEYSSIYETHICSVISGPPECQLSMKAENPLHAFLQESPAYHWFKSQEERMESFKSSFRYVSLKKILEAINLGDMQPEVTDIYFCHFVKPKSVAEGDLLRKEKDVSRTALICVSALDQLRWWIPSACSEESLNDADENKIHDVNMLFGSSYTQIEHLKRLGWDLTLLWLSEFDALKTCEEKKNYLCKVLKRGSLK